VSDLEPIDDVLGPDLRLLLVGINPGVRSSQVGGHFAHPGNRFWRALHAAGITPELLSHEQQEELVGLGVGITNLAARPSALASELSAEELREGGRRLIRLVGEIRPRVVAVLGVTAFRTAFGQPKARVGTQDVDWGGARWWVLHNPSGLNAHAKPADHAAGLREAAATAGLTLHR
jgi:double-stranded uracil-DNA glycosylase